MQKISIAIFVLIFGFSGTCLAATVGNPLDIDLPENSAYLRSHVIKQTLDEYEKVAVKGGLDIELIFNKDLKGSEAEVENAELEGQYYMVKLSTNLYNKIEPYIKIGTSVLEVKWDYGADKVKVEASSGLAWGIGAKALLYEFKNYGIRLTLDAQYRNTDPGVDKAKVNGAAVSATSTRFEVKEWQASLLASKKFIVPIGLKDVYFVPYGGLTYSDSEVDVSFTSGGLYDLYYAGNDNNIGIVLGVDVLPSLLSSFLFCLELRLINETALTIGGSVKF